MQTPTYIDTQIPTRAPASGHYAFGVPADARFGGLPGRIAEPDVREVASPWNRSGRSGIRATLATIHQVEGPRGIAARQALGLKWAASIAAIWVCTGIVNACFKGTTWASAPTLLVVASALMLVTASVGCVFMATDRQSILEQLRHYLFGLSLFPATATALFSWAMRGYAADPTADNFINLLSNSLPMVYAFTAFAPALIFVKVIAGLKTINKANLDDQEAMGIWTRNDGYLL